MKCFALGMVSLSGARSEVAEPIRIWGGGTTKKQGRREVYCARGQSPSFAPAPPPWSLCPLHQPRAPVTLYKKLKSKEKSSVHFAKCAPCQI